MTTTTPSGPGPGLRRIQLGHTLEELRNQAGKTQKDAAAVLDCARSRISLFESGHAVPRLIELPLLLEAYGASDRLDELEEIRQQAYQRGWWAQHQIPAWLQTYISLESDANRIRCFMLELVPGLLQTPDYARDILRMHGANAVDCDRFVAARIERQKLIGSGRILEVIFSEALLYRTSHMGATGRGQLAHLAEMACQDWVKIQVLPFAAGGHPGMTSEFTLLTFPDGLIAPMAYQEYAGGGHMADDETGVSRLDEVYRSLTAQSLDWQKSALMIGAWVRKEGSTP